MRVLVTGARGFIGSHTLRPLVEAGFDVHALSRNLPHRAAPSVTWHRGDLLSRDFRESVVADVRPTHLLHLAWETTHGTYWSSPANQQWVAASIALGSAFLESGGTRIVGAGTCAEYDWSEGGICDEEMTPIRPSTLYGASKVAVADALRTACTAAEAGFAWARLFFVYGAGEQSQRLVPSVVASLLRGEVALCTPGEQRRDFIYVADVASALVRLLQADGSGAFNVATGIASQVKDVVLTIATSLGAADRVELGALPARRNETPVVVGDIRRLLSLGWSPAYDLRAGIEDMLGRTNPV